MGVYIFFDEEDLVRKQQGFSYISPAFAPSIQACGYNFSL